MIAKGPCAFLRLLNAAQQVALRAFADQAVSDCLLRELHEEADLHTALAAIEARIAGARSLQRAGCVCS